MPPVFTTRLVAAGRYVVFHAGRECGEERWRIESAAAGLVATGEQRMIPPHPYPNASEYRVTLTDTMRPTGLEILWTVDSADSLGADYAQIERNVIGGLRGGAIILMHENHGQTVRALLGIFAALQRKHIRTVSVPQLLTDDPPSPVQVRAGRLGCGVRGRLATSD